MKKKKLRAGIIGSRFAASFHAEALKRVYGVEAELVGVYSPTEESRRRFAEAHGVKAFSSADDLIDAADVVHVCSPPETHEELTVKALEAGKHPVVEKPFTGFFGRGIDNFSGATFPREAGLSGAVESIRRMLEAERKSEAKILYAENWVYAPAVRKEREVLEKTGGQILWIHGEESHSGSHAKYYGTWRFSGGGSLIGKGCHPLTAALYLKRVEGRARDGSPIRPASVSGRMHRITQLPGFRDEGYLRKDYEDVEDFASAHVTFEDGTVADIFSCELVLGGVHNWLEVNANNHRAICNINPTNAFSTYNPKEENFRDIYVVEKIGTKQGWAPTSPDEDWFTGYQHEMEAFYRAAAYGEQVESDSALAADTIAVIYAAYLSDEKGGAVVEVPRIG